MIRSVIIDDEPNGVNALEQLLLQYCPFVRVTGTAGTISDGILLIENQTPDLVFLDIELPSGSGFEILKEIGSRRSFEVIFTTAYEQYAINAIRENALDYLLKPIDSDELVAAVERVRKRIEMNETSKRISASELLNQINQSNKPKKFIIPGQDAITYVEQSSIIRLEAASNYTELYTSDGHKHVISKTLKDLEGQLSDKYFFRTHRAHIVNLEHVTRFMKRDGGYLIMKDGSQIPVASTRREDLLRTLSGS